MRVSFLVSILLLAACKSVPADAPPASDEPAPVEIKTLKETKKEPRPRPPPGCAKSPDRVYEDDLKAPGDDAPAVGTLPDFTLPAEIATAVEVAIQAHDVADRPAQGCTPLSIAERLTTGPGTWARCCPDKAGANDDFRVGCMFARACKIVGPASSHSEREALTRALGPIDGPAKALGLVALLERDIFLPLSSAERTAAADSARFFKWQPYADQAAAVEVEPLETGYVVRLPQMRHCGCGHSIVRLAYQVGADGTVCRAKEKPVALAYGHRRICVD
jgi:hypothetical protein